MPPQQRDEQYWLDRAEEARLQADAMTNSDAKREMRTIVAGYRRLAEHAERTARRKAPAK